MDFILKPKQNLTTFLWISTSDSWLELEEQRFAVSQLIELARGTWMLEYRMAVGGIV